MLKSKWTRGVVFAVLGMGLPMLAAAKTVNSVTAKKGTIKLPAEATLPAKQAKAPQAAATKKAVVKKSVAKKSVTHVAQKKATLKRPTVAHAKKAPASKSLAKAAKAPVASAKKKAIVSSSKTTVAHKASFPKNHAAKHVA